MPQLQCSNRSLSTARRSTDHSAKHAPVSLRRAPPATLRPAARTWVPDPCRSRWVSDSPRPTVGALSSVGEGAEGVAHLSSRSRRAEHHDPHALDRSKIRKLGERRADEVAEPLLEVLSLAARSSLASAARLLSVPSLSSIAKSATPSVPEIRPAGRSLHRSFARYRSRTESGRSEASLRDVSTDRYSRWPSFGRRCPPRTSAK